MWKSEAIARFQEIRGIHEHPSGPRTDCDACWLISYIADLTKDLDNKSSNIGNLLNQILDLKDELRGL